MAMNFRERLHRATERGQRARDAEAREAAARALSEEECRRLHSSHRMALLDHIESRLEELADNFPGFRVESVVDTNGWGSVARRDDVGIADGRSENFFSRLQILVSPHNKYHVLDVTAKGTIRNKETFSRNYYQRLNEVDVDRFRELIEEWVLEYAELYAAAV
jgi:hypothetical protein